MEDCVLRFEMEKPLELLKPFFISETPFFTSRYNLDVTNPYLGLIDILSELIEHVPLNKRIGLVKSFYNYAIQEQMTGISLFNINSVQRDIVLGVAPKVENRRFHELSLAEQIRSIKVKLNITPTSNHILNKISIKDSIYDKKKTIIDMIRLKKLTKATNMNPYIQQITAMYFSGDVEQQELIKSMFRYSFITEGLTFKPTSLAQLMEPRIWQDMGIPGLLYDLHEILSSPTALDNIGNISEYFRNFFMNNLQDELICPSVKPSVFISASAIGWYGETGNRAVTEADRGGDDFLSAVCREWEGAADLAEDVRTVKIRTGLVLDPTGGALGRMIPLFRFGLGGKLGNGKQWWSWITLHDQVRAICHLMESKISGPVNLTAPNPSTNQEFTAALARAMHRPALFPAPSLALKIALGGFSTEILGSKRILPEALLADGFNFDYPHLTHALETLVTPAK